MSESVLPDGFAELERFVPLWAVADQDERHRRRVKSTLGELQEFYDAIYPRMDDSIAYLNTLPLCDPEDLPADAGNLYLLTLAFMMIAFPIDLKWGATDVTEALAADRVRFLPPERRIST